jgi:hypothetical protein
MEYFWAGVVVLALGLIIFAIISIKLKDKKLRKATRELLPALRDHIAAGKKYNVFMSHGQRFDGVIFLGLSEPYDPQNQYLPFPLAQWLILQKPDGKRVYIKPIAIRYYEDAE